MTNYIEDVEKELEERLFLPKHKVQELLSFHRSVAKNVVDQKNEYTIDRDRLLKDLDDSRVDRFNIYAALDKLDRKHRMVLVAFFALLVLNIIVVVVIMVRP